MVAIVGLPLISWNRTTLGKTEGCLAIRNLRHLRTAYLGKNTLKYLNKDGAMWVNILEHKYDFVHSWSLNIPPNAPSFLDSCAKI